jgi:outer membrane receptor for ferric coprogen and ferric-rhodotorulic acid
MLSCNHNQPRFLRTKLALTIAVLSSSVYTFAAESAVAVEAVEDIYIVGVRENRISKGATGLAMEIKDTPQTISTITAEEIKNFGVTGSNEALGLATGINVEQYETNRATFNARGFEIQVTQIDGLSLVNSYATVVGREDTFLFERIELIRGANGLLTGVGNASGTINYIRKRPTNNDGGEISLSAGSFDFRRAAVDYNKVLSSDGTWAGRLVVAHEDSDSFTRDLHDTRTSVYGVVDGQIGSNGTLTLGVSVTDSDQDSPMWGSLTLLRSDGIQEDFDVEVSTSQNWTYWDTEAKTGFVEYTHKLSDSWNAKFTYNNRRGDESTKILYVYEPNSGTLNPDLTGLVGWPYRSESTSDNQVLDANISGEFSAFGQEHSLLIGVSQSKEETAVDTYEALTGMFQPLPAFPYLGDVYTEPTWGPLSPSTRGEFTLTRSYLASRLTVTDPLKVILGVNAIRLERSGASIYGNAATNTVYPNTEEVSPYVGLTYDFTPDLLGYVSYSDIFQNQDQTDFDGQYLDPMKGVNSEVGIKAEWFDKTLLTTFAVFGAEQTGLATYAGLNDAGNYWYEPKDVKSEGFEFEATGRIAGDTQVTLGYTQLSLKGPDGKDIYEWVPRRTLNFRIDTAIPSLPDLRVGLGGRWQSDINKSGGPEQDAFFVANAYASYALSESASLRLNVNNLTDEKYIRGLAYGATYGAPRNASLSFEYKL